MRSFPTRFTSEKDRVRGSAPFFVLKCPFQSTGTIYLSDRRVAFASWESGAITKPWIADWGQILENIASERAMTSVSTMNMDVIIDPFGVPNIDTILETAANNPESTLCTLYLAYQDLLGSLESTDPPQVIWAGNIIDWERVDNLTMQLELADRSVSLDRYVGTKLNTNSYPNAYPDDVGKMMNIVYGAINMVVALRADWGAKTTLKAAISAAVTSLELTDASRFPSSGSIWIDTERIAYSSKSGNTLNSLTRGYNSTTAAVHETSAEVWEYKAQYDSIAAAHSLKTINAVYAEISGLLCRVDTGISNLVSSGKHLIRASNIISVQPASGSVSVVDSGHAHATDSAPTTHTANSSSYSLSHSDGRWSTGGAIANVRDGSTSTYFQLAYSLSPSAGGYPTTITVGFPTYSGSTPSAVYIRVNYASSSSKPIYATVLVNSNVLPWNATQNTRDVYIGTTVPTTVTFLVTPYGSGSGPETLSFTLYEVSILVYSNATNSAAANITVTGGSVETRYVDRFIANVDGYADDASGTFTGTANALIERPDHVVKHFLYTYVSWPVASFYSNAATEFGSTYKFSAVLSEYKTLKKWLAQMAWECRCWFRFAPTRAELLLRPDSLTSIKTITTDMVESQGDGEMSRTRRRSSLDEVINKISLYYNRDATKDGDEAYRSITETSDATSIARYGEKENPDLFYFDFIQSATMAVDVRDFYLARYKDRKRIFEFTVFPNCIELEFADAITWFGIICEIEKANLDLGRAEDERPPMVKIQVREY